MLITIKIHSTLQKFFDATEYKVSVPSLLDINLYFRSLHPRFNKYLKEIEIGSSQEAVALVDSKFRVIQNDEALVRRPKEEEVYYIVPLICGAGGRRGGIFAFAAIATFAVFAIATGGFGFLGAGAAGGLGGASAVTASAASASSTGLGFFGTIGASFAALPTFAQGLLGSLALSAITSLFTKAPNSQVGSTVDSGTRTENNMFGSLQNTTSSGTPIALIYGEFRVAGQFISGYLHTTSHGRDNSPTVQSVFDASATPNQ